MESTLAKRMLQLGLIALAALALSGCGGGDARALTASSMSSAEFAGRAEAICSRARRRGLRFQPAPSGQSVREAISEAIDTVLMPEIQDAIDEIYELGAPAKEKQQIETLLTAMQQAVDEGKDLDTATMERVEGLFAKSGQLARRAGLEACIYG